MSIGLFGGRGIISKLSPYLDAIGLDSNEALLAVSLTAIFHGI
jgi:hypothetical protein